MALLPSGLGWSAEESYMKQYAGSIAQVTDIPGAVVVPQGSAANIRQEGVLMLTRLTISNNDLREVYVIAENDNTCITAYYTSSSAGGCHVASRTQRAYYTYVIFTNGVETSRNRMVISTSAGNGWYDASLAAFDFNFSSTSYVYTLNPNLAIGADRTSEYANLSITHTAISKDVDGYTVAAFVKYKNTNGLLRTTPVLISSVDGYTFFSGVHCETYTALWQGMRFYISLNTALTQASPTSILTLDYSGSSYPLMGLDQIFTYVANSVALTVTDSGDPYNPGGGSTSEEAGGGGVEPTDDEVPLEPVTFPSAINTGFCRIYCPSASELSALSDYLWGPLFDLNTVKRLFSDPMSSVLGLSVVPVSVSGTSSPVSIAGVSTGISLPKLSAQHINVDLGSLQVTEKWGAYLDYEPYTKYSVYLPFIGYRTISADDIMGEWVHLSYDIDLLSGACVAKLVSGSTLLYQWAGSCAMQLPVNAANWNSVISSGLAAIGSTATAIASGGAAAPVVAGALASAGTLATQMKPNIERAGGLSGAAAFLSGRRAYMIRTMPELVNPGDQPHYIGYPSFITKQLGSITGFNVVEDIHLEGLPATQAELEEIDTLLHEGVIL